MDINGISTSLNTSSSLLTGARANDRPETGLDRTPEHQRHEHHRRGGHGRGRALGIFHQEMRFALKLQFHARFAAAQQNYLQAAEPVSTDDVATETLGTARQIVAESPTRAATSIAELKASVQQAAMIARQTVAEGDDTDDLDAAVATVDQGLDDIEQDVAANRESSASVLEVDTRSKQRSRIRIVTQEGDIVRFDLTRVDRMSASDVAVTNEDGFASSTQVDISSRSRLVLKVDGDLNESELAAIQQVFDQAEEIANTFFNGDIGAAFGQSQGFEFDSEQLAGVNLRFRMRQVTNISYAETVTRPAVPAAPPEVTPQPPETAAVVPGSNTAASPGPADAADIGEVVAPPIAPPAANILPIPGGPLSDTSALAGFFDLVSNFLRSIGDGFPAGNEDGAARLHYSESFKLELLRTVIHASAPGEADNAAANAGAIIDSVVDALPETGDS